MPEKPEKTFVNDEWCKRCKFNPDNTPWDCMCQLRFGENGNISFLEANPNGSCKKFQEVPHIPPIPSLDSLPAYQG